jgi:hypothetical protein
VTGGIFSSVFQKISSNTTVGDHRLHLQTNFSDPRSEAVAFKSWLPTSFCARTRLSQEADLGSSPA